MDHSRISEDDPSIGFRNLCTCSSFTEKRSSALQFAFEPFSTKTHLTPSLKSSLTTMCSITWKSLMKHSFKLMFFVSVISLWTSSMETGQTSFMALVILVWKSSWREEACSKIARPEASPNSSLICCSFSMIVFPDGE
jgi:hypothetical protein